MGEIRTALVRRDAAVGLCALPPWICGPVHAACVSWWIATWVLTILYDEIVVLLCWGGEGWEEGGDEECNMTEDVHCVVLPSVSKLFVESSEGFVVVGRGAGFECLMEEVRYVEVRMLILIMMQRENR